MPPGREKAPLMATVDEFSPLQWDGNAAEVKAWSDKEPDRRVMIRVPDAITARRIATALTNFANQVDP